MFPQPTSLFHYLLHCIEITPSLSSLFITLTKTIITHLQSTGLKRFRIPQSPAWSPSTDSSKSSARSSTIRSPFPPADWTIDWKTRHLDAPRVKGREVLSSTDLCALLLSTRVLNSFSTVFSLLLIIPHLAREPLHLTLHPAFPMRLSSASSPTRVSCSAASSLPSTWLGRHERMIFAHLFGIDMGGDGWIRSDLSQLL